MLNKNLASCIPAEGWGAAVGQSGIRLEQGLLHLGPAALGVPSDCAEQAAAFSLLLCMPNNCPWVF